MKPANSTEIPISNVNENAVSLPSRPANVPLADNTIVPVAISRLPTTSRTDDDDGLRRTPGNAGSRRRTNR